MVIVVFSLTYSHLAVKSTHPSSCKTVHTSNQFSTHSHSKKIGNAVVSNSHTKVLKWTHSPSHNTAYIGDKVSTHSHCETHDGAHILPSSHLPNQIHGDVALFNSRFSATKATNSPSHKMAHTSNQSSTHSGEHRGDGSEEDSPSRIGQFILTTKSQLTPTLKTVVVMVILCLHHT